MNKEEAIKIYSDVHDAIRVGQEDYDTIGAKHPFWEALAFLNAIGARAEASSIVENKVKEDTKILDELKEEYYNFLISDNYIEEKDREFRSKFYSLDISGKQEEEVSFRATHDGLCPTKEELTNILRKRWLEDERKRIVFLEEKVKENLNEEFNTDRLKEAECYLSDRGLLSLANKYLERVLKENGFLAQKKEELEVRKRAYKADEAAQRLFNILKEFNFWKLSKYDNELEEIKEVLIENDKMYVSRVQLYKELMKLPKYNELDEDEKIEIAMKIGALDTRDLSYEKEL